MPALDRLLGFFPFVFFAGLRAEEKKRIGAPLADGRDPGKKNALQAVGGGILALCLMLHGGVMVGDWN